MDTTEKDLKACQRELWMWMTGAVVAMVCQVALWLFSIDRSAVMGPLIMFFCITNASIVRNRQVLLGRPSSEAQSVGRGSQEA